MVKNFTVFQVAFEGSRLMIICGAEASSSERPPDAQLLVHGRGTVCTTRTMPITILSIFMLPLATGSTRPHRCISYLLHQTVFLRQGMSRDYCSKPSTYGDRHNRYVSVAAQVVYIGVHTETHKPIPMVAYVHSSSCVSPSSPTSFPLQARLDD